MTSSQFSSTIIYISICGFAGNLPLSTIQIIVARNCQENQKSINSLVGFKLHFYWIELLSLFLLILYSIIYVFLGLVTKHFFIVLLQLFSCKIFFFSAFFFYFITVKKCIKLEYFKYKLRF